MHAAAMSASTQSALSRCLIIAAAAHGFFEDPKIDLLSGEGTAGWEVFEKSSNVDKTVNFT